MDRTTANRLRRYILPVVTDARVEGEAPVFYVDGADRGTFYLTFSMDDAGALRAAVVDGLEASTWVTSEVGELLSTFVERVYAPVLNPPALCLNCDAPLPADADLDYRVCADCYAADSE